MRTVEVLATGPSALIEDLGRPGHAHLGVPPSGALDAPALRLANRLAGNAEAAAGIEALLGGLTIRARTSCTAAVTGPAVSVRVDEREVGSHTPVHLSAGQTLTIGTPGRGLRCYLALSGGIKADADLGSRSRDVLSELGPPPLSAGDVLPLGDALGVPTGLDVLVPAAAPAELEVPVLLGPRDDWFDSPAQALRGRWTVTSESNRVGLRLAGHALTRSTDYRESELPSEPLVTGAIQLPPSGLPVVFLADHPTTGGYPVIAVVRRGSLAALGQARPGTNLWFQPS
ncbi:MAG: allophanate hydrolase [Amycolatopsis sp.]|uniref:5-oxoprolinase subunit C family protein n=1 Tax=Amycolatopsis sp. TaxID=37632 RepID=UPI0026368294|nr:biotin-dependent carboxyltransferase family protein [Amycolatopsis sp.]MCU1681556.1 allophanate hydrolase [Amycolatopsis sp.]